MRRFKCLTIMVLVLSLITGSAVFAAEKHWVYDELAEFKQEVFPIGAAAPSGNIVTEKEWKAVCSNVFNEKNLDTPILAEDWAAMLKMVLNLQEKDTEQLIKMYVYGLTDNEYILREDATGGLVKLLTLKYISGSSTWESLKASENLKDIKAVSEKQETLVRMAYCEQILDSTVTESFRPKDKLTSAEAVSILNKVIERYAIRTGVNAVLRQKHWSAKEITELFDRMKNSPEQAGVLEKLLEFKDEEEYMAVLDKPVTVDAWDAALTSVLKLKESKYDKQFLSGYTYGLAKDGFVTRDAAAAGLMKLLHAAEMVPGRDADEGERQEAEKLFKDYAGAFDTSKLSICVSEGLIFGDGNGKFRPNDNLTNAEALVLLARVTRKYN